MLSNNNTGALGGENKENKKMCNSEELFDVPNDMPDTRESSEENSNAETPCEEPHEGHGSWHRRTKKTTNEKMELYDWVQCVISALLCGILLFLTAGRVIGVAGTSMLPTLMHGDRAVISNLFYTPKQGDIVIIQKDSFDEDPIVKRVIATEGQTVDIDFETGIVYVNDIALQEEYVNSLTFTKLDFTGKVTVPENCVFVLGDNRNASNDSRDFRIGMVDTRCILGKVYLIVYPGLDINENRDWSRVGSPY